jgi:hypothetical protein
MAASTWPIGLPQIFLIDGFAQGLANKNLIRSQMDVGPAKLRRRSTAATRPMQGSMDMTDDQIQILMDFMDEIEGGALPFYFPAQPPFVGTYLVRFGDELPQWDWFAPHTWKVDIKLEILPGAPEPFVPIGPPIIP